MMILSGTPVNGGVAFGKAFFLDSLQITHITSNSKENQKKILDDAIQLSLSQLEEQIQSTSLLFQERLSVIYATHKLMITDPLLLNQAYHLIEMGENAYEAYQKSANGIILMFDDLDNEYMKNRKIDIQDSTDRVLHAIVDKSYEISFPKDGKHIIFMEELKPSILYYFDKNNVLGFVSSKGHYNQHGAIIARIKDIPGIIVPDLAMYHIQSETDVMIDADHGKVYIEPTPQMIQQVVIQKGDGNEL